MMIRFHRVCTVCDHYHARWESEEWPGVLLCEGCLFRLRTIWIEMGWSSNPFFEIMIPPDLRKYNDEFYISGGIPKLKDKKWLDNISQP